ncbi:Hsp20 family protein [Halorubrum sp. JWXQ-INN 858]|uniref:archaeal heat shock protein Hsp14 n=1 Tax=Halorubrum sp. JWXQ-INN 858 TaxID=2690782 RepID=UPI00135CEA22|nr:archaeal heat shock protein Hsp14 [Halorubrum sp. JWXQ-INN 858]MWV66035.1 Hsp20 family protein [Halorubrum sp. JWXQ-INN 858]
MNRSNPFDEIEQFFGRTPFGGDRTWGREAPWARGHGMEHADVDVADYDDEFVVMADLPGYDREDIDVRATDGHLTISAERDAESDAGEGRYLRRERRHESVTRTIDLPAAVIEEEATAAYQNGVLTVTLPKEQGDDDADDSHRIDVE